MQLIFGMLKKSNERRNALESMFTNIKDSTN
jgi:hypothetical protein